MARCASFVIPRATPVSPDRDLDHGDKDLITNYANERESLLDD